ncbi:MAG: AAA family ATPase [Candidatus Thorarchaeota archaeon]|jgi:hypothetical protein
MEQLNINEYLHRESQASIIKKFLSDFENNKHDLQQKRGIYIYGDPGSGKTHFIKQLLTDLNYDIIKYDAGDIRNKSIIEMITKQNMSDTNVLSMLQRKTKKLSIIMDEIDGMNNGDKGGINSLIKLIRPKKTKKQKQEDITLNPIICIGNYHIDKKIKELMKVCHIVELKTPKLNEINGIVNALMPNVNMSLTKKICVYVQGDLRKLKKLHAIYKSNKDILTEEMIQHTFKQKAYNEDIKKIILKLLNNPYDMSQHNTVMNETDRTIVGLLWHENVVDVLNKIDKRQAFPFYERILENICFADYIDRITFQKQIWQFNEISSLIKTFYSNHLYHSTFVKKTNYNPSEIRFTKVLTKYSTEYNNSLFIQTLCQELNMDKKDMEGFFHCIRSLHTEEELLAKFENHDITKLDINRIYRFLDSYSTDASSSNVDDDSD